MARLTSRIWYGGCLLWIVALFAADSPIAAAPDDKGDERLPVKRVVIFNSGVGFFEHGGDIEGDAKVELKFNVDDVNDLLKSMVLQDLGGGRISTVTYGSKDPITKTLKTFAIDLTSNPTLADLLAQVRGEKVQVDAPNPIVGVIVGIEERQQKVGKDETIEVQVLNLLTDEGLRSIPLEQVGKIKLLDEKLDGELRQALATLAMSHATDKKGVTLNFLGSGKRPVRVGYIQEAPVWKTSYRLVLKDKEPPFLQGWAIVENTTETDWKDVGLTLVSGRPISFIQDLYQPLYVNRPVVQPELFASLVPQKYGQSLGDKDADFERAAESRSMSREALARSRRSGGVGGGGGSFGRGEAGAPMSPHALGASKSGKVGDSAESGLDMGFLQDSVQSAAQAGDVGELFQYAIATPVTLPRQQSAMLPIVNESIKGEKVAIYNPAVQAKHPLNGLKITNSTDLHLMQGPVTVFDDDAYAGDARLEDVPPGSERLLSYALDLDTEVAPESKGHPTQLVSVKIAKGVLHIQRKHAREQKYVVKNSGKEAKKVLIEYPLDSSWKLITPKEPTEKTRDLYRFAVQAAPGKPANLTVEEERLIGEQVAITNLDDNAIAYFINAKEVSQGVKDALAEVVKRKVGLAQTVHKREELQRQIQEIEQDQNRVRQNMDRLDRNSKLYIGYVDEMTQQETDVKKLRSEIKSLVTEEARQRKGLDEYILGLNLG